MKLEEQIEILIKEVQRAYYSQDTGAYKRICEEIATLKKNADSLYVLIEILKQLDNVQYMMHCYLPKSSYYDNHGSPLKMENVRNLNNLVKETRRLVATLQRLKAQLEALQSV